MKFFKIIVIGLGLIAIGTGVMDFVSSVSAQSDFGAILGNAVNDPILNNTFRFFSAVWLGFGVLLILFSTNLAKYRTALNVSFAFVILGGLGRVWSIVQFGWVEEFSGPMCFILFVELLLVPALTLWMSVKKKAWRLA